MSLDAARRAAVVEVPAQNDVVGIPAEVAALLGVLATLFLDNVRHLEETVDHVTRLVTRGGKPDRELIVALQAFDRLKQELEALSGALSRYADATDPLSGAERAQFGKDVINAITLADLKDRFFHRLHHGTVASPALLPEPDAAELEIDVIF